MPQLPFFSSVTELQTENSTVPTDFYATLFSLTILNSVEWVGVDYVNSTL